MTFAALCLFGALGQAPASSLTHNFGIMRADLLVHALNAETGWGLAGSPSLQQDYVYASVKDLTKEQAMAALAGLLQSRWVKLQNSEELRSAWRHEQAEALLASRSVDEFFKQEAKSAGPFTAQTAKDLVAKAEKLRQAGENGEETDFAVEERLIRQTPLKRAARAVAAALGRDFWAGLRSGQKVVFCDSPTPMQRAIPPAAAQVIASLREEVRLFITAVSQYSRNEDDLNWNFVTSEYRDMDARFGPAEILAFGSSDRPMCELRIWDPARQTTVVNENIMLADDGLSEEAERVPEPDASLPGVDPKEKIALSDEGASIFNSVRYPEIRSKGVPPSVLQILAAPEKSEILNSVLKEPMDRLKDKLGRGLIALVPDQAFVSYDQEPLTYGGLLLRLTQGGYETLVRTSSMEGDTMVLGVNDLAPVRAARFSRPALAVLAKGLPSRIPMLDVLADYALLYPISSTDSMAFTLFGGGSSRILASTSNEDKTALRLYGRLSGPQRKLAAETGVTMAFSTLLPSSQDDVQKLVYSYTPYLKLPEPAPAPGSNDSAPVPSFSFHREPAFDEGALMDPFAELRQFGYSVAFMAEPSRALGNGIPGPSLVTIRAEVKPVWYGEDTKSQFRSGPRVLSAENLATAMVMAERGRQGPIFGGADTFYQGRTTSLAVTVRCPPGLEAYRPVLLDEPSFAEKLTLETLPAEVRNVILKGVAVMRTRLQNSTETPSQNLRPPSP